MGATRVYVGGVPSGSRERDLERFFRGYGKLKEVLLKRGFAFVEFEDSRDADDAVYDLNGTKFLGKRVTVDIARGKPRGRDRLPSRRNDYGSSKAPTRTSYRLIVENLSSSVSWQDLKDFMRKAGEVTYADAHKHRTNEGIVEFVSYSDMKYAIKELDNKELNGRRIRLVEDRNSRDRRAGSYSSRSRSRSRSPRRSRSRSDSRHGSHSKRKSRSRSRSRNASVARNDKDKFRSRSNSSKMSFDRSRSNSKGRSMEPSSRSKNKSRSRSKSRSRTLSVDPHRSTSRERSISRLRALSIKSRSNSRGERSRSRSHSVRSNRSRSRSRSSSRGQSRSRSRTLSVY